MGDIRLPRNGKEGFLYGFVIAFLTASVMLTVNSSIAAGGFSKEVLLNSIKILPIMIVLAMAIQTFLVGRIAQNLMIKFSSPTDGFNARILFNILFSVTGMSILFTILGGLIATGFQSLEPFTQFFVNWPRNFCIALWCEILFAQPIARKVMSILHKKQERKQEQTEIGGVENE